MNIYYSFAYYILLSIIVKVHNSWFSTCYKSYPTNRPKDSETHFKVIVISDKFSTCKTPISRHRLVNTILKEEVASEGPVHALSILAYTPEKWQERIDKGDVVGPSPSCRGGDGSLPPKK